VVYLLLRRGENMITIEEAARQLGLTPRQVYRRIAAARRELSPYLRRGRNGALVLDEVALEILRVAEDLRKTSGVTVADAIVEALKEYGTNGNGNGGNPGGKPAESQRRASGKPAESGDLKRIEALLWLLAALLGLVAIELAILIAAQWK